MEHQSLHKDILSYVPAKLIPAISGMVSIFLLTKILKGEGYFNYSFLMALAVISFQVVNGWLNSSVIFLSQNYQGIRYYFFRNSVFTIQLYLLPFVCLILGLSAYFGLRELLQAILICGILMGQMWQAYFFSFLQVERKIKQQTKAVLIQSIAQLLLLCACFYFKLGLSHTLSAILISYLFGNLYSFFFSGFKDHFVSKSIVTLNKRKLVILKRLVSYGAFVCIWFFASQFYLVGDRLILKFLHIQDNVGGYTAFRDLMIGMSGLLTMPILLASHPQIMKIWHERQDRKEIEEVLSSNIRLVTILFTPVLLILFFSGEWLFHAVLGDEFVLPACTQTLIAGSIYLSAISMYVHKGFEVSGNTKKMALYAVGTAILSLICNYLLVPLYGIEACAAIAVVSQLVYIGCCVIDKSNVFSIRIYLPFILFVLLFVIATVTIVAIAKNILGHVGNAAAFQLSLIVIAALIFILVAKDVRRFISAIGLLK